MNKLYILFDMILHLLFAFIRPRGSDRGRAFWGLGRGLTLVLCCCYSAIGFSNISPEVDNVSKIEHDLLKNTKYGSSVLFSCNITVESPSGTTLTSTGMSAAGNLTYEICEGDEIVLTASTLPMGSKYQWDPDAGSVMMASTGPLMPLTSTDYTVQEFDAGGNLTCEATVTIIVNEPAAITINSPDLEICLKESTTLTAFAVGSTSYTYDWGTTSGITSANNTATITVMPSTSGSHSYTVTVTNAAGCISTLTETVIVNDLPVTNVVPNETSGDTNNDMQICLNDSATLVASGGVNYLWDSNANNAPFASVTISPTITTTYNVTITDVNGCSTTDNETVTVHSLPTANIMEKDASGMNDNNSIICEDGSATLDASVSMGGTGTYTYLWNDPMGMTTSTISVMPTATTTYNVTITDEEGCTDTEMETITVNSPTTVVTHTETSGTTANDQIVCSGDNVDLMASGGIGTMYSWTSTPTGFTAATSPATVTPMNMGAAATNITYTVVTTDPEGCTATDNIIITVNPLPTAMLIEDDGATTICSGDTLSFTASGGTSYDWSVSPADASFSAGTTTATAVPINTTTADATYTYTVVTTDANGCTDEAMVVITVKPLPILIIDPMETSGITDDDAIVCAKDDILFNYTGSGSGTPYAYDWNWTDGPMSMSLIAVTSSSVFNPAANQTFSVTVTDAFGCTNTGMRNVIVNANPTATASMDETICAGDATTISATGGGTYLWNDPNNSTTAAIQVTPPVTNTFTVTVTNTDGCTDTDEVEITVNTQPTIIITETDASGVADDETVCSGERANLTANPAGGTLPYMYLWDDPTGTTTQMVTVMPTVTTVYTVTVTDANGCEGTQTITITVPTPTATVISSEISGTTDNDAIICEGDDITLTASGGVSYQWDTGDTSPSITPNSTTTTTYMVTVTDEFGCTVVESQAVTVNPLPVANTVTLEICDGGSGVFDLTASEDPNAVTNMTSTDVDNGTTNTVTYYTTSPSGSGVLITATTAYPAANGSSVVAVVTDAAGCEKEAIISLVAKKSPVVNDVTLELCNDGTDSAIFDLTDAENPSATSNINGNGTGGLDVDPAGVNTVTYHTASPANAGNQVSTPSVFTTTDGTIVYALVSGANSCEIEAMITLNLAAPIANPVTLELCDDGSGIAAFTLEDSESATAPSNASGTDVDNTVNTNTVTYHFASPSSSANAISSLFTASNGTVVYALVEDAQGCKKEAEITLNVIGENANNITLVACGTGTVDFNLTDAQNASAISNASGAVVSTSGTVSYHTMPGPPTGANLISTSTAYGAADGDMVIALVTRPNGCTSESKITLRVSDPVVAAGTPITICEGEDINLIATFTPNTIVSTTAASWSWTGPNSYTSTMEDPTGFAATLASVGTYTVEVTDENGCTNTATMTVNVEPKPVLSVVNAIEVCEGENISLGATFTPSGISTIAMTWSWTGPNNFTSFMEDPTTFVSTSAATGIYTVEVTDNNGCKNSETVMVTVNPIPMLSAVTPINVCEGSLINLDATFILNGTSTSDATWSWTGPNNFTSAIEDPIAFAATAATAGTYTVAVTDNNGCMNTTMVVVTVNPLPTLSAGNAQEVCEGEMINLTSTFTATGVSTTATTWSWTGPNSFASAIEDPTAFAATSTGTYTVTVTDNNGCTNSANTTITVNPKPILIVSPSIEVCEGESINLVATFTPGGTSATAMTWSWTGPNYTSVLEDPVLTNATVAMAGTYDVVVTDNDGCTSMETVIVAVHLPPTLSTSPITACEGEDFDLMATFIPTGTSMTATAWNWTGPNNYTSNLAAPTITAATATNGGIYSVTVLDNNGCRSSANVMVVINDNPLVSLVDTFLCIGDIINLDGMPSGGSGIYSTHAWTVSNSGTTGATGGTAAATNNLPVANMQIATFDATGLTGGTATLDYTVTDDNGCSGMGMVDIIVNPPPTIAITRDTCSEDLLTYTASIKVTTDDTISVSQGTIVQISTDSFIVTGIISGANITVTATDTMTNCMANTTITLPACNCPIILPPVLSNDTTICSTDSIPTLFASLDTNQTAIWYTLGVGGTVLDTALMYTPTAAGSYFVEAWDTITNCTSVRDTTILTINTTPTFTVIDTTCNSTLDTFSVTVNLGINLNDSLTTSIGTIVPVTGSATNFTITNIPDDSTLVITLLDTLTGCMMSQTIVQDCDCLVTIVAPLSVMDTVRVCPTDSATMMVIVDSTETADWYSAAGDTLVLGDTSYVTNVPGTYYIVTRDTVGQCVSLDSTTIVLENYALPALVAIHNNQSPYCVTDSIALIGDTLANVVYAWTTNGTATISDTSLQAPIITNAANGEVFTLMVIDTITGCSAMLTDTVMTDTIPVITNIVKICSPDLTTYNVQVFTNATVLVPNFGAFGTGTNPHTIVGIPADSTLQLTLSFGLGAACTIDTTIIAPNCDCPMLNPPMVMDTVFVCVGDTIPTLLATVDSTEVVDWYSTATGTGTALAMGTTTYSPTNVGIFYTLTRDTVTGCVSDTTAAILILARNLPTVTASVSTPICPQDSITLIATGTATNFVWSSIGGTIVVNPTLAMTKAAPTITGEQFVLAGTDANGCAASDTVSVVLHPVVTLDTIYTICQADLNGYDIVIVTSEDVVTSSNGMVVNIGVDSFLVSDVLANTNTTITITNSTTGCSIQQTVIAPNCSCPNSLNSPVLSNLIVCKDSGTPVLMAIVGPGETVNWFDTIVGGNVLHTGPNYNSVLTTSGTYTFYAQTVDATTGCVSIPRTPVTLTILPLPNPNLVPVTTICQGATTTLTPGQFNGYFWSTGDTTSTINVGVGTYFVTVTNGNGCTAVANSVVDVDAAQTATLSTPADFCTSDAAINLIGGSPAGGTYSGMGVSGTTFDPALAGAGTHTISYALTNANGCSSTATSEITVVGATAATIAFANTDYCSTDVPFILEGGSPNGGMYSATGASGGLFNPAIAGIGAHQILYTVGAGTSCVATATATINVLAAPSVSFMPTSGTTNFCIAAGSVTLSGGSPIGGTYSGTGVAGGVFDPATAGIGTHLVTYTYSVGNCTAAATANYTVTAEPSVSLLLGTTQVCNNAGSITLSGGTPAGGTYSGLGVTNGIFDPTGLGAGNYPITYTSNSASGCTASATATITISSSNNVNLSLVNTQLCETSSLITLSGGQPSGGSYSGIGVVGNTFNPAAAGVGTHTITYTGDASTCFGIATGQISVISAIDGVVLNLNPPSLCSNSSTIPLTGGLPAGGTYSGTGVSGTTFDPTIAGAGIHTITYSSICGSAVDVIEVQQQLGASLALNRNSVCSNEASLVLSGGSPTGGTYSGPGISGNNTFNPSTVGPGTYMIIYTVDPGSGCTGIATGSITVVNPMTASINLPMANFCSNSAAFTLAGGSPAGGVYTGPGVSGNVFNPATAGEGTHQITYSVNSGSCSASASATVSVTGTQGTTFNIGNPTVCDNSASFALSGGFPSGGTYSGPGVVSGNVFDPNIAGSGTHTIIYSVADACSGTTTASATISVGGSGTSTLTLNVPQICSSSSPFMLSGGFPAGGTFSGAGVIAGGTTFDPSLAGAGTHTINYNPNDNCSGISTGFIIVDAAPVTPELRVVSEACVGEELRLEASAIPGATAYSWTGPNGFTSTFQNPVIPSATAAFAGRYNLIVTVGNCASTMTSVDVVVNSLPTAVNISNSGSVCQGQDYSLMVNNPTIGDVYNWYYENGSFAGTGTSITLNSATNPAGRYYTTVSRGGCIYNPILDSTAPSFAFTDVSVFAVSNAGAFAGADVTVCTDSYDLTALVPNDQTLFGTWSKPINGTGTIADPDEFSTPVFNLAPGNNFFIWTLSNAGCNGLSSDTVNIIYALPPVLTNDTYNTFFNQSLDLDVLINDQFTSGYFLDSVYTTGNGGVIINGNQTVNYAPNNTFIGTEEVIYRVCNNFCPNKCTTATANIRVGVDTTAAEIFIPTVITPNGDGMNDAFIIPEVIEFGGSELAIFNRWGDEVYRTGNYQNDWYGFWDDNQELLPVGTYFYVLVLNNANKTQMSGYIYIQRD